MTYLPVSPTGGTTYPAVLKLVSGSLEADLVDNENYALVSWSPPVARRDQGLQGGRGIYRDVPEEITIDVFGTTGPQALAAMSKLAQILDNADSWAAGDGGPPVILYVKAQESDLEDPLATLVVNSLTDESSLLSLPALFLNRLMFYRIDGATIKFTRRGQLLGTEETVESSTAVENPGIIDLGGFSVLPYPSPTQVWFNDFMAGTDLIGSGFAMITGEPRQSSRGYNFAIFGSGDMTSSEFTQTADAAGLAYDGSVMRINAASDAAGDLAITVDSESQELSVFVAIRNNTASTTWRVRARSTGFVTATGDWFIIDDSTTNPRIVALGLLTAVSEYHGVIHIDVETSQAVGTLDVSHVVILPHGDSTHYIAINGGVYSSDDYLRDILIDHRALSHLFGLVSIETGRTLAPHTIWDEYQVPLAAGAVDATPAKPGSGTRSVTDTESKITIE